MPPVPFPQSHHGRLYCEAAFKDLENSGCSAEEVSAFQHRVIETFKDCLVESGEDNTSTVFKLSKMLLDSELAKEQALKGKEQALKGKREAEWDARKKSGDAFVCFEQMVFDDDVPLIDRGLLRRDHCAESIWKSLPPAGSLPSPTPTDSMKLRREEGKIYKVHKKEGFFTDVSGRAKDTCRASSFGHIGPLAPSCRNQWKDGIIYSAGKKGGKELTTDEAQMLMYGSVSAAGANSTSLFTDASNFIFAENDFLASADPACIKAPIAPFRSQLENDGRPISALVLARDKDSLRLPGFLLGTYETLDPRIEEHKEQINMALAGLKEAVTSMISLYRKVPCPSCLRGNKFCPEVRQALDKDNQVRWFKFDQTAAGDRVFMKITFSEELKRGQPYPVTADRHPCPNLGFLALRNTNVYVNCLYSKEMIPGLAYDPATPAAVLVPACMDVEGGTRNCMICRRLVTEHVHGEAYYTSESGEDEDVRSSDSGTSLEGGKDRQPLSVSSAASLRDTRETDGGFIGEADGW